MSFGVPTLPSVDPWDRSVSDLRPQHGLYPRQVKNPDVSDTLQTQGWWQCPTSKDQNGKPCGFWVPPNVIDQLKQGSGYFACPRCYHNYDLMEDLPWHGPMDAHEVFKDDFKAGGGTRIGIPLADQGQLGENLVAQMGEIPGFGAITWWHPGGANAHSPLDGATAEWGVEVKTIGYDAMHHRFAPGGGGKQVRSYYDEKNQAAQAMGLKGILGVLVLLDYRRDVADIYAKPMPLTPWETAKGRYTSGVAAFRKNTAMKLVSEVPFQSPYKDPHHPAPQQYLASEYYQKPEMVMPPGMETQSEPAPF